MNFEHSFVVSLPIEKAWPLMCDIERIAPCVPGAQLQEVAGNEYRGIVKVKLGPITAQYKGTVIVESMDEAGHRMVMDAKGRETFGQGNANAKVEALLSGEGASTRVTLLTDLQISGKVAQLGRGVMQDVSGKLIQQFADALEAQIAASPVEAEAAPASADVVIEPPVAEPLAVESAAPDPLGAPVPEPVLTQPVAAATAVEVRRIDAPEAEAIDLLAVAQKSMGKQIALAAAVVVVIGLFLYVVLKEV